MPVIPRVKVYPDQDIARHKWQICSKFMDSENMYYQLKLTFRIIIDYYCLSETNYRRFTYIINISKGKKS